MAIFSVDVGGSSIKHAVIDNDGRILVKGKFATPKNLADFYSALVQTKNDYAAKFNLVGAGFSFPGAVDDSSGIIGGASYLDYIHNFPIRQELEKKLNLPVSMENDANCAALGEAWVGTGRDYQDLIFMVIGSGIGGAVVKNKHIHHGRHFHGGEFGYMAVNDDGKILSDAASTRALSEMVAAAKGIDPSEMNGLKVFELLSAGDSDAKAAVDSVYRELAKAIYNLQYSFDPEIFVIGGAISERKDFAAQIMQRIDEILAKVQIAKVRPKVVTCAHGNDANLLGAAYDFLSKHGC